MSDVRQGAKTIKLVYFKKGGKYYSEGEYESHGAYLYDYVKEVKTMQANGKLPGLVDGATEFTILIPARDEVDCVPHIVPCLTSDSQNYGQQKGAGGTSGPSSLL